MEQRPNKVILAPVQDNSLKEYTINYLVDVPDENSVVAGETGGRCSTNILRTPRAPSSSNFKKNIDPEELKYLKSRIQEEFIETERSYVNQLEIIVNEFLNPLRTRQELGISPAQVSLIFSNVEIIYKFHKFMLSEFESVPIIAHVLVKKADFLKMYTQYVNRYEHAIKELHKLRGNKKFQRFLKEVNKSTKTNGQDLSGFLILPVQRIPRYELLLKEMKKYTVESDPDYHDLHAAYEKIQDIANHINETKRSGEIALKLFELQSKISSSGSDRIDVIKQARSLIEEGQIKMPSKKGFSNGNLHPRMIYLLTDIILITNINFKVKFYLVLQRVRLFEVADDDPVRKVMEPSEVVVRLVHSSPSPSANVSNISEPLSSENPQLGSSWHPPEQMDLIFKNEQEKDHWIMSILKTKWELRFQNLIFDFELDDEVKALESTSETPLDEDHDADELLSTSSAASAGISSIHSPLNSSYNSSFGGAGAPRRKGLVAHKPPQSFQHTNNN